MGEDEEEFGPDFDGLTEEAVQFITPGEAEIEMRKVLGNEQYDKIMAYQEETADTELLARKTGVQWMQSRILLNISIAKSVRLVTVGAITIGVISTLRRRR